MRRVVLLSLWVGSVVVAQACGGTTDTGDDGGVDSSANDVTQPDNFTPPPDGNVQDVVTNPDTGTSDAGTDSSTTPDSGGKPITSWTCGNTTVSDCAQCIGHTQTCVYCANNDASVVSGTCVQFGTGCGGNNVPQGFNLCACPKTDGGVSACPEPYQVCLPFGQPNQPGVCDTCGVVQNTNGLTCQGGGKCDAVDGGCL